MSRPRRALVPLLLASTLGPGCLPFDEARTSFCEKADPARRQELCDPEDTTSPTVVSTAPSGTSVDVRPAISITFSEPMDPASLTPGTFSVERGETPVSGSVGYADATATFTPSSRLMPLGQYTARVTTGAKDAAGNPLAAAHEWSFTVRDGQWGTEQLLEQDDIGDATGPQVAANASGRGIAVWLQSDGIRDNVWASTYAPETGWGTPQLVERNDVGTSVSPQVGIDAAGNALVVWAQRDGSMFSIWANRYIPGAGWTTPGLLENINQGDALAPKLAMNASGAAIAVWQQKSSGGRYDIWANRYFPGVGWGNPERVELNDTGDAIEPHVALGEAGNAHVVWLQYEGTRLDLYANTHVLGSDWTVPERIETQDLGNALSPRLVVDGGGRAIAVWLQHDGALATLRARRFVPGTGWGSAQRLDTGGVDAGTPTLAVRPSGEAVVLWTQPDAGLPTLWARRFVPNPGWAGAETVVASETAVMEPKVAIDPLGNAIAVWRQQSSGRVALATSRYVVGAGWGEPQFLKDSAGDAEMPALTIDGTGVALTAWPQRDGVSSIWSNRRE